MPSDPTIVCSFCGRRGITTRLVTRSYGQGKDLLVIEGVPLLTCPHCRESYYTVETLHEIERIRLHRRSLATPKLVPVATYA